MNQPRSIEFIDDCFSVLKQSLMSLYPEEGCALLIGSQSQLSNPQEETKWEIKLIWSCRNIWGTKKLKALQKSNKVFENETKTISREYRFAIDPEEQLLAQKWARSKDLEVLGVAHSHPNGDAIPSRTDKSWAFSTTLMVIIGKIGDVRAWWMTTDKNSDPIEVKCFHNEERKNFI